ncbi:zinc-binding dehydrogenase [Jidongwangia harbinensis]|uniref:zinc-binding dehydrogenase n=1 Tax=Jidongwangia harbinensis TaxID=2878561 RepID=UPI001CDA1577|nr:zinc-binding dehydrogenase [Jidongwangia harbinensis]MCA2219184.1 zinc-binding dehydrogenase [Jidongwangia harbinensis]
MRVVEVARFGAPEVLTVVEAPDPVPGPGEVVVDVVAAEVLWVETMIRSGNGGPYFPVQPPYRPGAGVAGTVTAAGAGVAGDWIGRRVAAATGDHGGYVERALLPAGDLIELPDGLACTDAAAVLHDGTTALGLMDVVEIKPGDRVLVTAAGGGMGALLVQLAHAAGGRVVAAARGRDKLERLRRWGAEVVDYATPDWTASVAAAVGGLDVVLDGAGGRYGRAAFDLVVPGGRFSAHGTPSGAFAPVDRDAAAARGITVTGIERVQFPPGRFREYAARALHEVAAGRLTPLIGQTYPLDRAAEAHTAIENRSAVGKTLLLTS